MEIFDSLFAKIGDRFPVAVEARAGPLALDVRFADALAAKRIAPTFLPLAEGRPTQRFHYLTPRTHDLSAWVPRDRSAMMRHDSDRHYVLWHAPNLLYAIDRTIGTGIIWTCDDHFPAWECSRPALPLIQSTLRDTSWLPIHGASVGRNGKSLLLVGPGMVGKTTAALSCISAGWDYSGDDFVIVDVAGPLSVEPLYSSARLRDNMLRSFGNLMPSRLETSTDDDDLRHELRLTQQFPASRFRGGTVAAILLPRRGGAERPTIGRARPMDVVSTLLRTTGMFLPGWLDSMTQKFLALADKAPLFTIDTGMDPAAIPDALDSLLEGL